MQAAPTAKKKSKYDIGSLGVVLHLVGDAFNNIGVIISALVIWLTKYDGRYYADPMVSMVIALMILLSSAPLGMSMLHFAWGNILIY